MIFLSLSRTLIFFSSLEGEIDIISWGDIDNEVVV
jgi:hypothetical protein